MAKEYDDRVFGRTQSGEGHFEPLALRIVWIGCPALQESQGVAVDVDSVSQLACRMRWHVDVERFDPFADQGDVFIR